MISKQDPNNILLDKKINRCCLDYETIFAATYSSGRTWLICNHCIDDEAFRMGLTSRMRVSS